MKPLTEPKKVTLPNAWGRDETTTRQRLEVEEKDVNTGLKDYLGHGCRAYQFKRADVGREIEVMTAFNSHCWSFVK